MGCDNACVSRVTQSVPTGTQSLDGGYPHPEHGLNGGGDGGAEGGGEGGDKGCRYETVLNSSGKLWPVGLVAILSFSGIRPTVILIRSVLL